MAYTGTRAKLPLGELGLLTDIAPDKMPPNALIRANNVCFTNGCVQKAPGTIKWNATPLAAGIVAVHDWRPNLTTKRMIAVTSNGSIAKGRDRAFTTVNTTIAGTLTPNCVFAEGGGEAAGNDRKLFLFTGGASNPYVLAGDGTAFAVISRPSSDWTQTNRPKTGLIHRNRLWAFAGQISYASDSGNHENFQTAGISEAIYPGEGGDILGCFVFKSRMFAFKEGGCSYIYNDTDVSEANWYWQKVSSNFGLSAPNAVTEVLDDMVSGNAAGTLTSYAATQKLGSVEAADIIQQMQFEAFLRGNTSKVGVPFQHLYYYAEKKQLFATYRSAYYTYNDMLVMIDFARLQVPRAALWRKGSPQCLGEYKDINEIKRPMYGDKDGYLHLMDAEDRTEGGTAYTGEFQLPHLDFSHLDPAFSSLQKHFEFLTVHYIPESTGDLSCDYFIDGYYIDTITIPMIQNTRPQLDVLTLGTDRFAQPTTETGLLRIYGTGRTFSARFYQSGSNQSFQIPAVTVYFRGAGDEAEKT